MRWPADSDRPTDFLLPGKQAQRDSVTEARYQLEQFEETRESANLLYVALTRARHMLIISGCRPSRGNDLGWYAQVAEALCTTTNLESPWRHSFGEPTRETVTQPAPVDTAITVDARLREPIRVGRLWREIAPSRRTGNHALQGGEEQGRIRGILIHRMLQLAVAQGGITTEIVERVSREQGFTADDALLTSCHDEVQAVLDHPELGWIFASAPGHYSEVPVQYRREGQTVYGIIDRLLVSKDTVHIIDYKSHQVTAREQLDSLTQHYHPQLALYREAVARLWPDRQIHCHLLFTHSAVLGKM